MTREEAIEKLRTGRHRLEGALNRFYAHDVTDDPIALEAEALDVSVPIRVMIHHVPERKTISLLSHIEPDYWNKPIHFRPLIVAPPRVLPPGVHVATRVIPVNMTLRVGGPGSPGGTSFTRYTGNSSTESRVPLKDWWLGVCWDSGSNQVSNKDIIMALANKEGGAHVDDDLSAKYRAAKSQGHISVGGKPINDLVRLASLVGIAGDELLEYLRINLPELP